VVADVAPYQPGQFYLRELPPLRAVLDGLSGLSLLVIDGYADLDPDGRPGLGARARDEFGVPVIGVAKTPFRTATHAIAVLRGTSARPLYVTAAGMPRADAASLVRQMTGRHRLPDALRRADTLARHGLPPAAALSKPCPSQGLSRLLVHSRSADFFVVLGIPIGDARARDFAVTPASRGHRHSFYLGSNVAGHVPQT